MTKKQKVLAFVFGGLFMGLFAVTLPVTTPQTALAAECTSETNCCDGVATSIIGCETKTGDTVESTGLWQILIMVINILSAGVGVVALGGIVFASILYTSAGGSEEQVKKAMGIISNVVIGVVAWALMWALLNFLVPGGLFNAPAGG